MSKELEKTSLAFHHVGLLTDDIIHSRVHYAQLFGNQSVSEIIKVESQKVQVCFVKMSEGNYIELVQPTNEESIVFKMMKKRVSYYHVAYKVQDIVSTVDWLESLNYKAMEYFNSEAFNGKRCVFLFSPETHLIELIEE